MSRESRPLPPFASEWMAQWRAAGPLLQEIRDRELRELTPEVTIQAADLAFATPLSSARVYEGADQDGTQERGGAYSGLIEQQAWFMRLRLLQAERKAR